MAVLNLRDVPEDLAQAMRVEAAQAGLGIREYCIAIFRQRRPVNLTKGFAEVFSDRSDLDSIVIEGQKNSIAPPRISMGANLAAGSDYGVAVVSKDGEIISEFAPVLSGTPINKEPFRPKPMVRQIMYIPEEPAPVQENGDGCPHGFNTRNFCITMKGGCK